MKFTNTYRYVVLKQVMFLILFLIILVCMIKIDLEYLKQEVRIVFAFVIYFAIKIGLFFGKRRRVIGSRTGNSGDLLPNP